MLVGNKCDLENIRDVSVEEGKSLAESEGLFFMETSALDSTNVKKAFEIVIREIYNNVSRKVLNSDSYKAELSVNRVSLVNDGADGSKQTGGTLAVPGDKIRLFRDKLIIRIGIFLCVFKPRPEPLAGSTSLTRNQSCVRFNFVIKSVAKGY
ncbi:UNVERIFIED_CONTAM: Ras-related protein RABA5b [Sesamum radiatum]|uniref:Ras-related protein RABA5b n=1 Tax=Sesamum radiatum TaxID=300843 RepID=A0AAW2QFS7_SESRA